MSNKVGFEHQPEYIHLYIYIHMYIFTLHPEFTNIMQKKQAMNEDVYLLFKNLVIFQLPSDRFQGLKSVERFHASHQHLITPWPMVILRPM